MPWTSPAETQILAIHAALIPTPDGIGEIVMFGGDQHNPAFIVSGEVDATRRLSLATMTLSYVRSPPYDLFCSGHSLLPDGRLLVAGGTVFFPDGIPPGLDPHGHGAAGHFPGHRRAGIYNGATNDFSEVSPMGGNPAQAATDEGGGRWYPTLVTLANGDVLALAGHPSLTDERHSNPTPERYRPVLDSWTMLPPFGINGAPDYYPRLHLLPSGKVFCSSFLFVNNAQCVLYDAFAGTGEGACPLSPPDYHGIGQPSVLLPLLPGDNYRPRILRCGAPLPYRIRLEPADPDWTQAGARTGSAAGKRRDNGCAVILPDGRVLVVGGVNGDDDTLNDDSFGVKEPELYDPEIAWDDAAAPFGAYRTEGAGADRPGVWQTVEDAAAVARNYHSTALLLPDGRVWTAGSSRGGLAGPPDTTGRLNYEIFTPPYPAGGRPELSDAPASALYGQSFEIRSPQAGDIRRVALVRCGSVTHAFDCDQRYVALSFEHGGGDRIVCHAPPHGGVAPPGPYMLFVVDQAGRPCARAKFIRIGGIAYLITNRSQFAREEISTFSSPATVPDALLLVLDGYLPADLALPAGPAFRFVWADDPATEVPGMHAVLFDVQSETGALTPGVGQRFVLQYGVRFDTLGAFDALPPSNQRGVNVSAQLASGIAVAGRLTLFRDAKPYLKDGDVPWLSIDVRVVQRPVDGLLAGVVQGDGDNAGTDFVNAVLDRFNAPDAPPGDEHPFAGLPTAQEASQLELSSHVGTVRVFNYAFARVRYRAPAGQDANAVRLFFRMMATTGTSLNYNPATVYPRMGDGAGAVPQFGQVGPRTVSVPYFAAPRGGDRLAAADPLNVRSFAGAGAAEVRRYFGCWLDFNQRDDLRELARGDHQCLVAEMHWPPRPIEPGAAPADSDALSQRNLAFVASDNPGGVAGHLVQHSFELLPLTGGRQFEPATHHVLHTAGGTLPGDQNPPNATASLAVLPRRPFSELMIRWGDLPRDSIATIFLPDIDMATWLEATVRRPGQRAFELVDAHTVRCTVGGVSFLPVPAEPEGTLPGLLSIQLPPTVKAGRTYRVSAHQIAGKLDQDEGSNAIHSSMRTVGSFELAIPVGTGPELLRAEERRFAVLSWIAARLPAHEISWIKVFERYLGQISDRVRAFGGDPAQIPSSPAGGPADQPGGHGGPSGSGECRYDPDHRGRIVALHYGWFGLFLGFDLATAKGCRRYHAFGKRLGWLAARASKRELEVVVWTWPLWPRRACGLTLLYKYAGRKRR